MFLQQISVEEGLPDISGKYIITTTSTGPLKLKNTFIAMLHISHNKGKIQHTWDIRGQKVTHWYKELNAQY